MASFSNNFLALGEVVARLGALLMALVASKDERLRETIANAATRALPHHDPDSVTHWHARYNPASNRRVE